MCYWYYTEKMRLLEVCIVLFLISFSFTFSEASSENPQVKTTLPNYDDLTVTGETLTESSLNRPIHRFLGIPYAEPPVGKLRFRRPVRWNVGTKKSLEALNWPNSCYQDTYGFNATESYLEMPNPVNSEDCLYLNIWTPEMSVEEAKTRPVLVWIHGGGLYFGGSSFELYNGETLASRADAVVVSINYRLSTFGFLYSDKVPEVSGNQGLWDQALALKWVRENIASFGGNPNEVTIFGESAGSWSVSAHILSPVSRNLYSNAILMSGAVLKINEPVEYAQNLLKGIRVVGCATQETTSIDENVVECLENLDLGSVFNILMISFEDLIASTLVKDGEFFPDYPAEMIAAQNHKTNFNLLLSTVEDEAQFMLYPMETDKRFAQHNPEPITLEGAQQYLDGLLNKVLVGKNVPEKTINKFYFSGLNPEDQDALRRTVSFAYGDYILGCPTFEFAKSIFKSSPDTIQAYQWYYTAKVGNPSKWVCSSWSGACHTDDLFPVFGVPFRYPDQFHNRERDISNEVINYVKSFIRTGNPGNSQWESYFIADNSAESKEVIAPYYEIGSQPQSSASFKFNLKQLQCQQIWNQFIY